MIVYTREAAARHYRNWSLRNFGNLRAWDESLNMYLKLEGDRE